MSFSAPEAFQSPADSEPDDNRPAVVSDEEFFDSATREFLLAEDYVVGMFVGLRARAWSRASAMQIRLVRRRTRAYFSGCSHTFGRILQQYHKHGCELLLPRSLGTIVWSSAIWRRCRVLTTYLTTLCAALMMSIMLGRQAECVAACNGDVLSILWCSDSEEPACHPSKM